MHSIRLGTLFALEQFSKFAILSAILFAEILCAQSSDVRAKRYGGFGGIDNPVSPDGPFFELDIAEPAAAAAEEEAAKPETSTPFLGSSPLSFAGNDENATNTQLLAWTTQTTIPPSADDDGRGGGAGQQLLATAPSPAVGSSQWRAQFAHPLLPVDRDPTLLVLLIIVFFGLSLIACCHFVFPNQRRGNAATHHPSPSFDCCCAQHPTSTFCAANGGGRIVRSASGTLLRPPPRYSPSAVVVRPSPKNRIVSRTALIARAFRRLLRLDGGRERATDENDAPVSSAASSSPAHCAHPPPSYGAATSTTSTTAAEFDASAASSAKSVLRSLKEVFLNFHQRRNQRTAGDAGGGRAAHGSVAAATLTLIINNGKANATNNKASAGISSCLTAEKAAGAADATVVFDVDASTATATPETPLDSSPTTATTTTTTSSTSTTNISSQQQRQCTNETTTTMPSTAPRVAVGEVFLAGPNLPPPAYHKRSEQHRRRSPTIVEHISREHAAAANTGEAFRAERCSSFGDDTRCASFTAANLAARATTINNAENTSRTAQMLADRDHQQHHRHRHHTMSGACSTRATRPAAATTSDGSSGGSRSHRANATTAAELPALPRYQTLFASAGSGRRKTHN